jgi:cytochrome bd-type quinol oxidase subunit 2
MANDNKCPGGFAWGKWVSLFCAFSFLMLGGDATLNHVKVLTENHFSYTPLIFAPLAVVLCLAAFGSQRFRRGAWVVGLLALLVGAAGTGFHVFYDFADSQGLTLWQAAVNATRPPLAPGAFASTGILMVLVALAERWPLWKRRKGAEE